MLAIHTSSGSFAPGWVEYCKENAIPFKSVDCFSSDIIDQLKGCRALLWHWQHNDYRAALFARQLTRSLETMGLIVFPGSSTCWHYDDKVGQKYLLEAVEAPLINTHVFYDEAAALAWLGNAALPKVWKLRGGAGSRNVKLVRNLKEARRIVRGSFRRGWRTPRMHALQERYRNFRKNPGLISLLAIGRGLGRAILPHEKYRNQIAERNYVYFQDFIPENDHDIRIIVIGDRAFGIKRMVRDGDFRASGSGVIIHDQAAIPEDCIQIALDVTKSIGSQCCAFDFVQSENEWKIIEISYAFSLAGYLDCPGYWDSDLSWHPGAFRPEYFMIEDVITRLSKKLTA